MVSSLNFQSVASSATVKWRSSTVGVATPGTLLSFRSTDKMFADFSLGLGSLTKASRTLLPLPGLLPGPLPVPLPHH